MEGLFKQLLWKCMLCVITEQLAVCHCATVVKNTTVYIIKKLLYKCKQYSEDKMNLSVKIPSFFFIVVECDCLNK